MELFAHFHRVKLDAGTMSYDMLSGSLSRGAFLYYPLFKLNYPLYVSIALNRGQQGVYFSTATLFISPNAQGIFLVV